MANVRGTGKVSPSKRSLSDDDNDNDDDDDDRNDGEALHGVLGQPFQWFIEPTCEEVPFDWRCPRTAETYRANVGGRALDECLFKTLARYNRMVDMRDVWPQQSQVFALSAQRVEAVRYARAMECPFTWLPFDVLGKLVVPHLLIDDLAALVCTNTYFYVQLRNLLHERIMATPYMHPSMLSHELLHMIDVVLKKRESLFLTGEAGTGKTTLLSQFVQYATLFGGVDVLCVAPTGLAAKHLDGLTIHSAFRLGRTTEVTADTPCEKVDLIRRSRRNTVLVIDEVSMCTANLFDLICRVVRTSSIESYTHEEGAVYSDELGFGLIVACGDFAQLPPIVKGHSDGSSAEAHANAARAGYAFQSALWQRLFGQHKRNTLYLQRQRRQRSDTEYVEFLRRVRTGRVTSDDTAKLQQRVATQLQAQSLSGTLLCTRNALVDDMNKRYIDQLPGTPVVLPACERGLRVTLKQRIHISLRGGYAAIDESTMETPEGVVKLKVGARVLLTANHHTRGMFYNPVSGREEGDGVRVPNGSVGVVEEIVRNKARFRALLKEYGTLESSATAKFHAIKDYRGNDINNLRLRVYNIEKPSAMSFEHLLYDARVLGENPELESLLQHRTMLDARIKVHNEELLATSPVGTHVWLVNAVDDFVVDARLVMHQRRDQPLCVGSMTVVAVPLIRFDSPNVTALVVPYVERHHGYAEAGSVNHYHIKRPVERVQIAFPLRVARAITAHKAQGATLRQVTVDMNSMFEYGHPYVMLSRVPAFSELWLSNNSRPTPAAINRLANPWVTSYYEQLARAATTRPLFDAMSVLPSAK